MFFMLRACFIWPVNVFSYARSAPHFSLYCFFYGPCSFTYFSMSWACPLWTINDFLYAQSLPHTLSRFSFYAQCVPYMTLQRFFYLQSVPHQPLFFMLGACPIWSFNVFSILKACPIKLKVFSYTQNMPHKSLKRFFYVQFHVFLCSVQALHDPLTFFLCSERAI